MKKGQSVTSFYVESLLLVVVFVCIRLALTSVFGLGRRESVKAGFLTSAVTLAQNAADGFFLEEAEDSEGADNAAARSRIVLETALQKKGVL